MVVSVTNAVNHPIKHTKPSLGVVNWRLTDSGRSAPQQMPDLPAYYVVEGEPHGVEDALLFHTLIDLRLSDGDMGREV